MATVETLNIDVNASVDKAVGSLKRLSGALSSVEAGTRKNASSTRASAKATSDSANAVGNLAKQYRAMGLTRVAKQFEAIHKAANLAKGATRSVSDAMATADSFARNGQTGIAERIRGLGGNPMKSESALKVEEENQKERAAIAKEAAKEEAAAVQRAKRIAAESERAYTQIVNEEARKRSAYLTECARTAAASEKAYHQLTTAAARQAAKEQIAADKQAKMEQAARAKSLAAVRKQEARDAAKAEAAAQKEAAKAAKESEKRLNGMTKIFGKFGDSIDAPFKKIRGLFRALGRIALYRALRTIIKGITSAIKEGVTNLKAYSKQVGTAFAPAVDNLRKHVLWLKNAFATALRPVIEALIPVIQRLVDWLVKASDFLAQVFSIMTGKVDDNNRYTRAVLTDLQDSNEEAKKLQRTLLGFDEINRLDGDNGKDNTQNAGLMFEQADVSEKAVEWAAKLTKWIEKIKEVINSIDWDTVLKVLIALKATQILRRIAAWIKPIAALLGGSGGIVALALAVAAAFGLWGDKIQEFIESTGIKKVEDFFEKLKKPFGKGGLADTWLTNGQLDLTYLLKYIGRIAKIIHALFHGDVDGALAESKKSFADYFNYLKTKFDLFAGWLWDNIVRPVLNWGSKVTYDIYRAIYNTIIDIEIALNKAMIWVLQKWNDFLGETETNINHAIEAINYITGKQLKPVNLHVEMKEYYDAVDTLEKKKLPPLKENVKMYGTWAQEKAKFNLDTSEAERKVGNISQKIAEMAKKLLEAITKGSNAIGSGGSRNESPFKPNQYASGGFPAIGTMFIAGERGAEYVGDIGGRTGVMNTDQMAAAIYTAMNAALANNPQGGGDIYLDGEKIYTSVVRRNNNQVRSTGRTALLT